MKRQISVITIIFILIFTVAVNGTAQAKDKSRVAHYEVTFTNITRGQIISPPIVISHDRHFELFALGEAASPGLAALAEDANTSFLVAELDASDSVFEYQEVGGVIEPGMSATITIKTKRGFQRLSMAAMLVSTNDAFAAVRGVYVGYWGAREVQARAYDSGSERNSENCDYIPGPPCGNGGVRDEDDAEGYVYVHSGIHGIGDLAAETFTWQNPVASISIQRVK